MALNIVVFLATLFKGEIKKSNKQAHHIDINAIDKLKPITSPTGFDLMKKIQKNDSSN